MKIFSKTWNYFENEPISGIGDFWLTHIDVYVAEILCLRMYWYYVDVKHVYAVVIVCMIDWISCWLVWFSYVKLMYYIDWLMLHASDVRAYALFWWS